MQTIPPNDPVPQMPMPGEVPNPAGDPIPNQPIDPVPDIPHDPEPDQPIDPPLDRPHRSLTRPAWCAGGTAGRRLPAKAAKFGLIKQSLHRN